MLDYMMLYADVLIKGKVISLPVDLFSSESPAVPLNDYLSRPKH